MQVLEMNLSAFSCCCTRQNHDAFLFLHLRVTQRSYGNNAEGKEIELAEFSGHGLGSRGVLSEDRRSN